MNDDQLLYSENNPMQHIESMVKDLREKAFRMAGMFKELKQQNKSLEEKNAELEAAIVELRSMVEQKNRELHTAREGMKSALPIDVGDRLLYFSPDEREALERQINDLLARVSSHLR